MDLPVTYSEAKALVVALALTQPRILAIFIVLPLLNSQIVPSLVRFGIAGVLGLMVMPLVQAEIALANFSVGEWIAVILKEAFVGFVIGYIAAIPFWIFEAIGFLVDNQRGASIASTLNPLTGNDSSPLGILFNQAFMVYFLVCGGCTVLLGVVFDSFSYWSVTTWFPHLTTDTAVAMLRQLDYLMRMAVLLAAPILVAMFLAELGLALVSRFVPQLQVFFMAMPIKSALAMLVMMLYAATLFDYAQTPLASIKGILPLLREQFGLGTS